MLYKRNPGNFTPFRLKRSPLSSFTVYNGPYGNCLVDDISLDKWWSVCVGTIQGAEGGADVAGEETGGSEVGGDG